MEYETVRCQVCNEPEQEGIVTDYRIKPEFEATRTYKTPLECYYKYTVCSRCFKLPDKAFRSMLKNRKTLVGQNGQNNAI